MKLSDWYPLYKEVDGEFEVSVGSVFLKLELKKNMGTVNVSLMDHR